MHFNVDQPSIVWTKEIHGILLVSVVISWTRPCSFFFERCNAFRLDGGSSFSLKWNGIWWVYPVDHIFGEITWNRNIFTSIFEDPSMIISSPCWADVGTGFFFQEYQKLPQRPSSGISQGFRVSNPMIHAILPFRGDHKPYQISPRRNLWVLTSQIRG